jgi:hypothetical protein
MNSVKLLLTTASELERLWWEEGLDTDEVAYDGNSGRAVARDVLDLLFEKAEGTRLMHEGLTELLTRGHTGD